MMAASIGTGRALLALGAAVLLGCGPSGGPSDWAGAEAVLTETEQSPHFVFRYAPGDRVDVPYTEAFYAWVSGRLSVDLESRIQYLKFQSAEQQQSLTGYAGNALAFPWADTICTIWPRDNHEITHVLTYRLGAPTDLFNEGMAVANQVDPLHDSYTPVWNVTAVHSCAKDLLLAGQLPTLASIGEMNAFRAADPNLAYPAAGSFVEHLLEQYGMAATLRLFTETSWQDAWDATSIGFERVFGISPETAEQDWRAFLEQYSP